MADATVFQIAVDAVEDLDCLSDDERVKAATFRSPADGRAWAAARAALRSALSDHIDVPADQISFDRAERGRLVLGPGMPSGVAFNMARSYGLALVAVSTAAAIGVDVEAVRSIHNLAAVARRVLRADACAAIAGAPLAQRELRFFREWVRHEARLKCRGTGLVEPTDDDGRTDDLTLLDLPLDARHAAAVAVSGHDVRCELVDYIAPISRTRVA